MLIFDYMESETATKETISRPPVVVILGHIDHGKSSLLETIKDLKITSRESGGITQHIGAYEIEHKSKKITFIDTPGHEAFCAIRSRGAEIADIAILVIASDEGIKPQTIEALDCAKNANLPTIIAISKIDKPSANPQKIKNELVKHGIITEDLGGSVPVIELSALQKKGIDELIEIICLTAEVEGLKDDNQGDAAGVVIEAYLDSKRGPAATLLIKKDALSLYDIIATQSTLGKVRIMEGFQGKKIEKALVSQPVVVIGLENVPKVGEKFRIFSDIESAREYVLKGKKGEIKKEVADTKDKKILNLIVKTDVIGSLDAVKTLLKAIPQTEVFIRVLKSEVGEVNEDDINLAVSSSAKVVAFRTKASPRAAKMADQKLIDVFFFEIIYELAEKIKKLTKEIIESETIRKNVGRLKVLIVFKIESRRQVVGGRIIEGEFSKGLNIEVLREEKKIGSGMIINLQKNKKDIENAAKGEEIGILYEGSGTVKEGDVLAAFSEEKKKADF